MEQKPVPQPTLFPEPTAEGAAETEKPAVDYSKPTISTQEITSAKPALNLPAKEDVHGAIPREELKPCAHCGKQVFAGQAVMFSNTLYHEDCAPFAGTHDLKANPRITATINAQAADFALLLKVIEDRPDLKALHDKVAATLCEHDNYYLRCDQCGKVVSKGDALIGGILTKAAKKETGAITSVPAGKFFSKVRTVEVFCSKGCDGTYAAHLRLAFRKQQEEKASKATESKSDGLKQLLKLSVNSKELKEKLAEILASVQVDKK